MEDGSGGGGGLVASRQLVGGDGGEYYDNGGSMVAGARNSAVRAAILRCATVTSDFAVRDGDERLLRASISL